MTDKFAPVLIRALANADHVTIYRSLKPTTPICGYIAAVGDDLFAIHVVEANVQFNGQRIMRISDIGEIRMHDDHALFTKRALAARGLTPSETSIDLSSWRTVVEWLAETEQIAGFEESLDLDSITLKSRGKVVSVTDEKFSVRQIDDGGIWKDRRDAKRDYERLIRIDFGGILHRMLGELAQEPASNE